MRDAAQKAGVPLVAKGEMFRASEDFGYYTKQAPGAMFYLGSGDAAPLHTAGYDFSDQLIETAVEVFMELAK